MPTNNMRFVAACLVTLILQISSSAATTFTVGDTTGWTDNLSSTSFYSTWASGKTFAVGDVLVFNFQGGHTVTEVSKSDYDSCSGSNPISSVSTGPASITINSAGAHYYICTVGGHCNSGQKLSITATATSSSSTPPPSTSPSTPSASTPTSSTTTTTNSPPPPPSSATTAGAHVGFVLPLLLVVAAFFL